MKLSVIIPVFNEINFLEKFTSNLTNAFKNVDAEYIFVNDGSTDGSGEWLSKYVDTKVSVLKNNKFKFINLEKNKGKGFAINRGIKVANGEYFLFQDADLELDPKDSREIFELINNNSSMKVIFGSRFLSGKLRSNKNFINEIIVRINSLIFNILFNQSITDLHCGTKIIAREVIDKAKLSINDFGFEIDIATQISKNNYQIYEYGVSYFSRSKLEGKKITWIDGVLSYFYLFKTRFLDNDISVVVSIIYSSFYMAFVGSYFSMGNGKIIIIIVFLFIGSFIGLYKKLFTSSLVFLCIYLGSFFSKGNGQIYPVIIFFIIGLYLSSKISSMINKKTNNKVIKTFV